LTGVNVAVEAAIALEDSAESPGSCVQQPNCPYLDDSDHDEEAIADGGDDDGSEHHGEIGFDQLMEGFVSDLERIAMNN
jgi:hypothetical protein